MLGKLAAVAATTAVCSRTPARLKVFASNEGGCLSGSLAKAAGGKSPLCSGTTRCGAVERALHSLDIGNEFVECAVLPAADRSHGVRT